MGARTARVRFLTLPPCGEGRRGREVGSKRRLARPSPVSRNVTTPPPTLPARGRGDLGRHTMKVGFIGLGRMGGAMVRRLLDGGHEVAVYNRTADKMKPLVDLGAKPAASIGVV